MPDTYLKKIAKRLAKDDYREESLYPALGKLIKMKAEELGVKKVDITQQPRKTEAGNPDMRIWDGGHTGIGYIEAKRPGADLGAIQESDQLKRYRSGFPNVILTDFFEFRLFKDGELVDKVSIGRPFVAKKLGEVPPAEHEEAFNELLQQFFSHSTPVTRHASSLAKELAKRTRYLEHIIEHELVGVENKELTGFYQAFQQYLIAGLSKTEFADLYAQTVTYGLFAARTRAEGTFTRENARQFIPSTIGILRDVFEFISYRKLPQNISWIVDDIAQVLNAADTGKILKRYYEEGKGADPIIHFYETFLSEYDPGLREQRGVYYTPEPVVGYIVRSVHQMLKEEFGKPLGLADDSVTVLDPAAGTLTFIAEAFKVAVNEYATKYGAGGVPNLIKDHLLEHFYAFELMMAPYAIGHLKMGFILDELGYHLSDDERFKLYLTNTLEMEELEQTSLPGMASLSEESKAAGKVKKEQEVLVILGNPPYSGHSANKSEWIDDLLKEGYTHKNGHKDDGYYFVDGKPLGERNPKWLQDDYVKFIRFAQWKIDQYGQGIIGFITNHSYLDNPTFRGMRESLTKSFDDIHLLDLHGNSLKKETAPDGSKDENVFDIRAGVSIALLKKSPPGRGAGADDSRQRRGWSIQRSDLYGLRNEKYEWLDEHDLKITDWKGIKPQSPFYFFKEQDYQLKEIYGKYIQVTDLFPINGMGMTTAHDDFVIAHKVKTLITRFSQFKKSKKDEDYLHEIFEVRKKKGWSILKAWDSIQSIYDTELEELIYPVAYRPFDSRYIIYHDDLVWRIAWKAMKNMILGDNLAICIGRQWAAVGSDTYDVVWATDEIIDINLFRRGGELLFPLYLYPEAENGNGNGKNKRGGGTVMMVFEEGTEYTARRPNINKEFYALLEKTYRGQDVQKKAASKSGDSSTSSPHNGDSAQSDNLWRPTPEQILYYTYAVLYAPAYRQKYAEFLKSDFPRVPFTKDYMLFNNLAELGKELTELHLMKSDKLNDPIAKFQGKGPFKIGKAKKVGRNYQPEEERVYINKDGQYFEGIPSEVWEYQIGGYQVLDKWLYDRRERKLSNEEIQHYCKVATALYHTIALQKQIDELYAGMEEDVIEM